jgi:hypothetical protein
MDMGITVIAKAYANAIWACLKRVWAFVSNAFWTVLFPFLLGAQVVVPVYLIDIRLVMSLWATLDEDDDSWTIFWMVGESKAALASTITILVLSILSLLLWTVPLGYCLWSYYWVAARWIPVSAPEAPSLQVEGESRKRRYCDRCKIWRGDRTYHCRAKDKCLPMYDHTCFWWTGAIWLHNLQAYLVFICFLPVYQLFILGVSLWVTLSPEHYWHANAYISLGIPSGFLLIVSVAVLWQYTQQLVVWNILHNELDHGIWYLTDEGDVRFWDPETNHASTNPWNKGWRQNLLAIFSHRLKDTIECAYQGDTPILLRPLDVTSRRAFGASTGFEEDVELGNLVRRSQSEA